MTRSETALKELLGRVFDDDQEELRDELGELEYERRRHDFIFHMTDWSHDLEQLSEIFSNPEGRDVGKTTIELIGILYHAIPHLSAAGRLLLGHIPDPFVQQSNLPGIQSASSETL